MNILNLFIIVPLITVILILFSKSLKTTRLIAAIGMTIQLLLALWLMYYYLVHYGLKQMHKMIFVSDTVWFPSLNIHYAIGVDGISTAMILLTAIVIFSGVFVSWKMENLHREFFISLIVLATGVFGFFISYDLFTMLLYYELAVIPMYLLIGIWGSGPKEKHAMKLTLMLMAGSALIIAGLLGIYFNTPTADGHHTFNMLEIAKHKIPIQAQRLFFPLTFVGFGVLGALFPFHTWSPDGHASAPTAVSMLHAGVLMKLGTYGVFRVAIYLMPEAAHEMAWIFIILTSISVVYGAFGAIMQKDLKYINAYSSVSHVGMITFGLLMMNATAIDGAILQMISHGLMTALFFALIGMIYGRTHTRNVYEMGGLLRVIPFLGTMYMIAGFASLGLPGFSGFVAELNIFTGAFLHADLFHRVATILVISSIVVTAVYILRFVGIMLMGPIKHEEHLKLKDATWYEKLSTITLVVSMLSFGLYPVWLINTIMGSLKPIMLKILGG